MNAVFRQVEGGFRLMADEFTARCDRAVRDAGRGTVGPESSAKDIRAAFEASGYVPVVEDAYRIGGTLHVVEDRDTSQDPDFAMIGADYRIADPDKAWFVLTIQPGHGVAERVRRFVKRRGALAYWPRQIRAVARGRGPGKRLVTVVSSLCVRYVLLHLRARGRAVELPDGRTHVGGPYTAPFGLFTDHEARFSGIGGFVDNSQGPAAIPDVLVERLVERERAGEFDETVRRGRRVASRLPDWLFVGNFVLVKDGPFAGFSGLVETIDDLRLRCRLTLSVFGRATPLDLDLAQLERLC